MTDRAAEHWASRHIEHARKDTRSDAEVAGEVRMLVRSELLHEMIVVRARDRIALLSYEANHAAAIVAEMQWEIERLQQQLADARQALTRIKSLCHTAMKLGHERDSLIVIEAMCSDAEGDRE